MAIGNVCASAQNLRANRRRVVLALVLSLVLAVIPSSAWILPARDVGAAGLGVTAEYTVTISEPPDASIQLVARYSGASSPLDLDLGFKTYSPAEPFLAEC